MKTVKQKIGSISCLCLLCLAIAVTACKTTTSDVLPSSTLPANYDNQGTLIVKSNTLHICIWDWSVVDGDVIDLLVNGKTLLSKYELTADHKCLDVKLPDGESWIGIIAISEGSLGAASPHVELSDGVSTQAFDILGYISKPGGYKIKVQK
ncbi:hypothetical protein [Fibrella arboris]|uniref:hypothetical protein n=1 Tax=Fibrella arboris TaxID=3242486 RepID=UPI0035205B49